MDFKTLLEMSLLELVPVLPFLIYIIVCMHKNSKRFDKLEELTRTATIQSGIATAWSSKEPPFIEAITAILNNINLGANGNHIDRAVQVIMSLGKDKGVQLFHSVLNSYKLNNDITPYFLGSIEEIERQIK